MIDWVGRHVKPMNESGHTREGNQTRVRGATKRRIRVTSHI